MKGQLANIVVLIDPFTRNYVDRVEYDALSKHVSVITDIRELSDSYYDSDLVLFEPSVPAGVSPEILEEMIRMYNIRAHLICSNKAVMEVMSFVCNVVLADFKVIEWRLIYAVVNQDLAILESYSSFSQNRIDFASTVQALPNDCYASVNRMYNAYLDLGSMLFSVVDRNSRLEELLGNYKAASNNTVKAITELRRLLKNSQELNRVYSALLSKEYDVTFSGLYSERPKVLYIKTVTHLAGVDQLLMVLYAVLTRQRKSSCKILKLVDQANALAVRYTPNNYFPLHNSYNTQDVLTNDFLLSLGSYQVLMSLLMLNRSGLDFLIVHDQRGTLNSALDDQLIDLKLYEVSADYAVLGEYENMLTDIKSVSEFHWDFKEVAECTGSATLKLTSHPTVSKLLDYLI